MKIKNLNTGGNWQSLQETNDSVIVIGRNNPIILSNSRRKRVQARLSSFRLAVASALEVTFSLAFLWLDIDPRVFSLLEFNSIARKTLKLLFKLSRSGVHNIQKLLRLQTGCASSQADDIVPNDSYFFVHAVPNMNVIPTIALLLKTQLEKRLSRSHQPQTSTYDNHLYATEILARLTNPIPSQTTHHELIPLANKLNELVYIALRRLRQMSQCLSVWHLPYKQCRFTDSH